MLDLMKRRSPAEQLAADALDRLAAAAMRARREERLKMHTARCRVRRAFYDLGRGLDEWEQLG